MKLIAGVELSQNKIYLLKKIFKVTKKYAES